MKLKDKEIFKNKQELIEFCNKSLDDVGKLQDENLKKLGSVDDENFVFFSFIHHFIDKPFWTYPVTIIYNDRPDFIIESGNRKVSLEVTGQKTRNWRYASARAKELNEDLADTYFEGVIKEEGKLKYTDADIKQKISYSAPPSMGDNAEKYWIERTICTIVEKNEKVKKYPEIETFSNHILLIFDYAPESVARSYLTEKMFADLNFYKRCNQVLFERVVCIDGSVTDIDVKNKQFKYCGKNKAIPIIQNARISEHCYR